MRAQTELYSLADRMFFDHPERWNTGEGDFTPATDPTADGWTRRERDGWIGFTPDDVELPWQGWKIHVSAVPDRAQQCLDLVSALLIRRGTAFKFLRRPSLLRATNLKYAPRSASGKFITIYPADDGALAGLLLDLDLLLQDLPGPYILSDLRFRSGPLFVRFGGFRPRYCLRSDGERSLAVSRPDGVLVPDERTPGFTVPDWVDVPSVLADSLAGRTTGDPLPYAVESALHFSNGGGVYLARPLGEVDADTVVLKEARPWAGLAGDGADAVTRLHREADALQALAGVPGIPALIGRHRVWEHHFIAVEHLPGRTLQAWVAEHHPLVGACPDEQTRYRYVRRAGRILDRVREIIDAVHAAGYVMGDLHPANILVDDEDRVGVVDFESAVPIDRAGRQVQGHAGFVSDATGTDIDRHALEVLALWIFLPMTELLALAPERRPELTAIAVEQFPGAAGRLRVDPDTVRSEPVGPAALRSMGRAILASATPDRDDRLYPGDLTQFEPGQGAAFGHGAAGVVWALHVTGRRVPVDHVDWLERAAERPGLPAGFLDGAAGVAHVLATMGRTGAADRLLREAADALPSTTDVSLASGSAGIGWALLHAGGADGGWQLAAAQRAAGSVIAMIDDGRPHGVDVLSGEAGRARDAGTGAGLLRGWSGAALFLHQLYRRTGDRDLLSAAQRALHRDLRLCVRAGNGSLQGNGGFRSWPYLELGSAGIALVVDEILTDVEDPALELALPDLVTALRSTFVVGPHLGRGRAGLMAAAARLATTRPCLGTAAIAVEHLCRLHWHRVDRDGEWAFPGDGLHRLSMDFLTGTAGVLTAATSTVRPGVPMLPFLPPARLHRTPHFERTTGADAALPFGNPTTLEPLEGGSPCPFSICS